MSASEQVIQKVKKRKMKKGYLIHIYIYIYIMYHTYEVGEQKKKKIMLE